MGVWVTIWVVLMMFWLFGGGYWGYDPAKPQLLIGNTLVPWLCMLIIGLIVFGAISAGMPVR